MITTEISRTQVSPRWCDLHRGGRHWNGQYYQSMPPVPTDYRAPYDPNIHIVMAAIYGAIPVTDTKLLAIAAQLRSKWADPGSTYFYPINGAD